MIKKLLASLSVLFALCGQALALSDSAIPTKVPTTWAQSAPGGNSTCPIPIPSQIAITAGRASWTDGFPPVTFLPLGSGGVPPFGADFNGVLCQLSQWTRWLNAGGPILYDATFQSAIGGYPNGALISSVANPLHFWISRADNNASNPDTGGANWIDLYISAAFGLWGSGSGGTPNAQTFNITGWTQNLAGIPLQFVPSNSNTGPATLQVSGVGVPIAIQKKTLSGLKALTGGELVPSQIATVQFDGNVFELSAFTAVTENLVVFSGSGTYTPSSGIVAADVECIGGGGGGGGSIATAAQQVSAGGGGAAGSRGAGVFTAAQLLPSVAVTIGPGGTVNAGSAGNTGGTTTFGALISSPGGGGGSSTAAIGLNSAGATGVAGSSSAGTAPIATKGALAQQGIAINFSNGQLAISGSGGPGLNNAPGGAGTTITSGGASGATASGYGSGGGGAANAPSQTNLNGGLGASGACLIKELIAQ